MCILWRDLDYQHYSRDLERHPKYCEFFGCLWKLLMALSWQLCTLLNAAQLPSPETWRVLLPSIQTICELEEASVARMVLQDHYCSNLQLQLHNEKKQREKSDHERPFKHLREEYSQEISSYRPVKCDKITIWIRSRHFWCEVTSSDQFSTGESLISIEAHLNAIGLGSPILRKESGSDKQLMGLSELLTMLLFPLKHPICLSKLMHALTRYNGRCDLRLSYFGSGWLTLWC